jgi:hypothetical protein
LRAIKPGEKITLVVGKLLLQLRPGDLGNIGLVNLGTKLGSTLLHLVAVFGVTSQHVVLFMPTHHQHGDQQVRVLKLIYLRLDVMHRSAQAAFKT